MTEQTQETKETIVDRVFDLGRKSLLAGIGAMSLAQEGLMKGVENVNGLAGKMVERGEEVSKARREALAARAEKRQEQVKDMRDDVSNRIGETYVQASEAVLSRANVPTRTDVQDLSKQIDSLSRKVDKVRKEQKEVVAA